MDEDTFSTPNWVGRPSTYEPMTKEMLDKCLEARKQHMEGIIKVLEEVWRQGMEHGMKMLYTNEEKIKVLTHALMVARGKLDLMYVLFSDRYEDAKKLEVTLELVDQTLKDCE